MPISDMTGAYSHYIKGFETDYYHFDVPGSQILVKKDFTQWISAKKLDGYIYPFLIERRLHAGINVSRNEIKSFYYIMSKTDEQLELF